MSKQEQLEQLERTIRDAQEQIKRLKEPEQPETMPLVKGGFPVWIDSLGSIDSANLYLQYLNIKFMPGHYILIHDKSGYELKSFHNSAGTFYYIQKKQP